MTDPISEGGKDAVRYAVSTIPLLITVPVGLILPLGVAFGAPKTTATFAFSAGTVLIIIVEYARRGSVWFSSPVARRRLLAAISVTFWFMPVLTVAGLVLGWIAIDNCFGVDCTKFGNSMAVVGFIFSILSAIGSIIIISYLRSEAWARFRAASEA